jgi:pyrroline-5-carboxylate reductase
MSNDVTPILLLGAGRMGGALISGWTQAGAFRPAELIAVEPVPSEALTASGVRINPPEAELARARTVVLAVKPQVWREAAAQYAAHLAPDAVIVSIAAGVRAADISQAFGGRRVARIMPTTAVAIRQGTASIFAPNPEAKARAHALFGPVATVVDLDDEDLMHAATGVSGSAPAYLYAFVEALEAAGVSAGLDKAAAEALARATIAGAAALLAESGEDPAELRRQVTSPGGTTAEALKVLMGEHGLEPLLRDAVAACVRRSRELAG